MKRTIFLLILSLCAGAFLSAQGIYFDVGGGFGMTSTYVGGGASGGELPYSWSVDFESLPLGPKLGFDVSGKVGFAPISRLPLYVVGEISWSLPYKHEVKDEYTNPPYIEKYSYDMSVNHLFFGPGFVFYPTNSFQFSGSIGLVNTTFEHNNSEVYFYSLGNIHYNSNLKDSGIGFGFNLSGAIDLGSQSGFLLGGKLSYIDSEVDITVRNNEYWGDQNRTYSISTFHFGLFMKYRFKG